MGTYPLGLIISERHNFTLKTKTTTLTAKLKLLSQEGPLAMRCDAPLRHSQRGKSNFRPRLGGGGHVPGSRQDGRLNRTQGIPALVGVIHSPLS